MYLRIIFFTTVLWLVCPANADRVAYSQIALLRDTTIAPFLEHYHDWSMNTVKERAYFERNGIDVFSVNNQFSWIQAVGRSGEVLWKQPSPAFSWIGRTADQKYIVGLSNIKYTNPIQVALFDSSGNLVFKRRITDEIGCFSEKEYYALIKRYPEESSYLQKNSWKCDSMHCIEFPTDDIKKYSKNFPSELFAHRCDSSIFKDITETVTNWVFWYDETRPDPIVVEKDGLPQQLLIRSTSGGVFRILITEKKSKIEQ